MKKREEFIDSIKNDEINKLDERLKKAEIQLRNY